MGILRHSKLKQEKAKDVSPSSTPQNEMFTPAEAAFLVSKLRQAQYTGVEFEQFYQIMAKLTKLANTDNK